MTPMMNIIKDKIEKDGPLDIGAYMELAMGHPEHGYYVTRDPLGQAGDFTTAPEISQMFGEMIGVFLICAWEQYGEPEKINLVEFGPGKGTLMRDVIRVIKNSSAKMYKATQIHLVEISPVLREQQAKSLPEEKLIWHDNLSAVPEDAHLFVVGNEFLDVLPFRQFVKQADGGWHERFVNYDEKRGLHYTHAEAPDGLHTRIVADSHCPIGEVFEVAPVRNDFITDLCGKMRTALGTALFIDYGQHKSEVGNTFQALKDKAPCDVLEHVGDADLTSRVDFQMVREAAQEMGATIGRLLGGPCTQADFLRVMNIDERKISLKALAGPDMEAEIEGGYNRLMSAEDMGELFKVLEFGYWPR